MCIRRDVNTVQLNIGRVNTANGFLYSIMSIRTVSEPSVRQTVRKKLPKHSRKPSETPADSENFEDVVLHKVDTFLYQLEQKLDELEEFGLAKLEHIDDSVHHAYQVLRQVRDEAIGEGWRKAESVLKVLEAHYPTVMDETCFVSSKVFNGIVSLEEKLSHVEATYKSVSKQALEQALLKAKDRLLDFSDIPAPWRENPNIQRGYRFTESYIDCAVGVWKVHNETCNIWTHLLGFGLVGWLVLYHLPAIEWWPHASAMDKFTVVVYMAAAMNAMICSATWHAFSCLCTRQVKQRFACVDYSGITILIAATIVTCEYASLYCQTTIRNSFMAITGLCGIGGAVFTWAPSFDKRESRGKRIAFFVSFAVAGVSSFFTAAWFHGFWKTLFFHTPILQSLLMYIAGVTIYGLEIPEKWYPGMVFDYVGASHNLWHIAVVAAIYLHYQGLMTMMSQATVYACGVSRF